MRHRSRAPRPPTPHQLHHSRSPPVTLTPPPSVIPAPPPITPAPPSVIPAQAGTTTSTPTPSPNSSLPPSRGEVRWGVGVPSVRHRSRAPIAHAAPTPSFPPPSRHSYPSPFRYSCAPLRHSCAGRNHPPQHPPPPPIYPSPLPGGRLGGGWESRACATGRAPPIAHAAPTPLFPLPFRHSYPSPSVTPAPSPSLPRPPNRHSCLRRNDGGGAGMTQRKAPR